MTLIKNLICPICGNIKHDDTKKQSSYGDFTAVIGTDSGQFSAQLVNDFLVYR